MVEIKRMVKIKKLTMLTVDDMLATELSYTAKVTVDITTYYKT